jgi:hypothetical protein
MRQTLALTFVAVGGAFAALSQGYSSPLAEVAPVQASALFGGTCHPELPWRCICFTPPNCDDICIMNQWWKFPNIEVEGGTGSCGGPAEDCSRDGSGNCMGIKKLNPCDS